MKRNFIGLLVMTSSLVHGATVAPEKEPASSFKFSFGAVFLQPTGTDLDYAVLGYPLPVQSPHWAVGTVRPSYSAGFDLAGNYRFKNNQNDVELNWTHLKTSDSDATIAGANEFAVPLFQAGPSAGQQLNNASQQAHATARFNYDVINLDAGQLVNYGNQTQLRFFAGLSGAQLKETLDAAFQDNAATYNINSENKSKFTGAGPLFGVDGYYQLPYNVGFIGTATASALIGSLQASTQYTSYSPQLAAAGITTNYQSITPKSTQQVVPGLDGKLGLNYSHVLGKGSEFTLEVGYEYATYFNAIVAYNPAVIFGEVNLGTIALSSLNKSVSNFSVNGPFINASVRFI